MLTDINNVDNKHSNENKTITTNPNVQERKEDHRLDAQELGQRLHRCQFRVVRLVEQHQTVHGSELAHIVDGHQVRVGHVRPECALTVYVEHLADPASKVVETM